MNTVEIFACRLKQARIKNQMSMEQLCHSMEGVVTKQTISKYELAKMMPSSTILTALSKALNVDLDYFFRPFKFHIEKLDISFRKKASVKTKETEALKVQIQDELERYLEVEEILECKPMRPTKVIGDSLGTSNQMKLCAQQLRQDWGLGIDPIANVQQMLEEHGIRVLITEGPENFDGLSGIVNEDHYMIVLNRKKEHIERRRLTTLHELAHLLYNQRFRKDMKNSEIERLCNAFASEMLLPSEVLIQRFDRVSRIATAELKSLQVAYGISIDAIMMKLKQLEIITEQRYRGYCIRRNQEPKLKDFVEKSRYTENLTDQLEVMVYAAVARDLISTSKAASLLHQPVHKIRERMNAF